MNIEALAAYNRWQLAKADRTLTSNVMRAVFGDASPEPEDMTPEQREALDLYDKADQEFSEASEEWSRYCPHKPERLWTGVSMSEKGRQERWFACCDCGKVLEGK